MKVGELIKAHQSPIGVNTTLGICLQTLENNRAEIMWLDGSMHISTISLILIEKVTEAA
jgi:hypothetical protein